MIIVKATELMENKGIKYTYYNLDDLIKNKIIKDYIEYIEKIGKISNNYLYIPAIFKNRKFIGGFDELKKIL